MGTKKYASLAYSRLYEEQPNNLLEIVGYAIAGKEDLNTELLGYLANSQAITAQDLEKYYAYGKEIYWGYPKENYRAVVALEGNDYARNFITNRFGIPDDTIEKAISISVNNQSFQTAMLGELGTYYGYNPFTNTLNSSILRGQGTANGYYNGVPSQWKVELLEISPNFSVGSEAIPRVLKNDLAIGHIQVKATKISSGKEYISLLTLDTTIALEPYRVSNNPRDNDFIYVVVDEEIIQFVILTQQSSDISSHTYYLWPSDSVFANSSYKTVGGEGWADFYPWIPIRSNQKFITNSSFTAEDLDISRKMGATLKTDVDSLISGIRSSTSEDPDDGVVDDAYIYPAIDLLSKQEEALNYVFDYFKDYYPSHLTEQPLSNNLKLTPRLDEANYNIHFTFREVLYTSSVERSGKNNRGEFHIEVQSNTLASNASIGYPSVDDGSRYILYRRIEDNTYESVSVSGLSYVAYVRHGRSEYIDIAHLKKQLDSGSRVSSIRLPIIRSRMQDYPFREQGLIAIDAVGLEMGVYQEVDSSTWKRVLGSIITVAAIVVTVVTGGFGGTVLQIAQQIAVQLVKTLAVAYIGKLLIKEVGGVVGAILAVAVAIIIRDLDTLKTFIRTASAEAAMILTNTVLSVYEMVLANEQSILEDDIKDFAEEMEGKEKALEAAYELLPKAYESEGFYAGLEGKEAIIVESPTDFFFRTTHVGNPGAAVLDAPSYYVDSALDLSNALSEELEYIVI